ncbi:nicotinate phosphoribosyltransferase [Streptomyces chromofuscus]|uniref:Nicotinate phosphoribosyltransferase n=1 Tax=Streptomyces chromofuscus TaxID=42881 RepID=A0A7M2T9R0_STRCW|nr:nicotinate phosphoribosyltransferase [Streptomyces chromofuscus]QOV44675.1 nicotinate phosphoribosyltransferase [Streptomyces chromofuscus]GGT01227.1 nicotinate phosphoribosyltransferase [Streptomyces chromofuscus]
MSDATTTDLYEVTMAMSYLTEGVTGPATFSLFVRDMPPGRGFLVAAGLESALDFLSGYRITREDVEDFSSALRRPPRDLEPLLGTEFTGKVRAVPEGRIVLAGEPLLEVTAPLPQAQLVETYVLNQVNHQTTIASKAARCVLAAAGHPVVDFSLRRTHGPQAGFQAARLSGMVGFTGTSNVAAAAAEGLPAVGTMAHSYVEAFAAEEDAFRAFARSHPGPVTLLVDTYDTEEGVRVAARVLRDLDRGPGSAVRLDSGDLGALALRARAVLDAAGLPDVRIIASGGLDEYSVDDLVRSGVPIDVYAVGTRVGVSADAPFLDSAYKLVEYDGRPVMKLSSAKVTAPGQKQVFRCPGYGDVIGVRDEQPPRQGVPLLVPVMERGRRTVARSTLEESRKRFAADLAELPPAARRIRAPVAPRAVTSGHLTLLTEQVRRRIEDEVQASAAVLRHRERSAPGTQRSVP